MKFLALLWWFTLCMAGTPYATHWVVTENGLIKSKVESQYALSRSHDLLAFLNQENRWHSIHTTFEDLMLRQANLEKLWSQLENDTDITQEINSHEVCNIAGQLKELDWYASHLEDGSKYIDPEEYKLLTIYTDSYSENTEIPDCKKISSLPFSIYAFDHLEAMTNRHSLTIEAEHTLPKMVAPMMTIEKFGHWVATTLRQNTTSWLHYNLASLYWRFRGNALEALECSRRAAHYCTKEYEHIPLLSMGTIFYRAKKLNDSNLVIRLALKNNMECAPCHFILANSYAITGDFKRSLAHYNKCFKLDAGFYQAIRNSFGVLCLEQVLKKTQRVYKSLIKMRENLSEYTTKEALWIKNMSIFITTMKHDKKYLSKKRFSNCVLEKMSEMTDLHIRDLTQRGVNYTRMSQALNNSALEEHWKKRKGISVLELAYNFQGMVNEINELISIAAKIKKKPYATPKESKNYHEAKLDEQFTQKEAKLQKNTVNKEPTDADFEKGAILYPRYITTNNTSHDFDTDYNWPGESVCTENNLLSNDKKTIYPVYVPFENKGLSLKGVLTYMIGVSVEEEHELPWAPPLCPTDDNELAKNMRNKILLEVSNTEHLKRHLLRYAGDGFVNQVEEKQLAEIGQRIRTAIEKNVAPKWMLYTLSSLYWRVQNNKRNALSCLITAKKLVTSKYKDVVFTSLASVYLEMGYLESAWRTVHEDFLLSLFEPASNLLLAQLHMLKANYEKLLFHLKLVVRVSPRNSLMSKLARRLLVGWACELKDSPMIQKRDEQYCTPIESNLVMVCRRGRKHCTASLVTCPARLQRAHLPGQSTDAIVGSLFTISSVRIPNAAVILRATVFDPVFINMPVKLNDKTHEQNFARLVQIIRELKGCETEGCSHITAQEFGLTLEGCRYQYLHLPLWAEVYGVWEFRRVPALKLPAKIADMSPSEKKIPDCQVFREISQDFILIRISKVAVKDWEPLKPVMHALLDEYDNNYDFEMMGMKIAAYVEEEPHSWLGLVAAAWWCGASGRGACCVRCVLAACAAAPSYRQHLAIRLLGSFLHLNDYHKDGQEMAHLAFYTSGYHSVNDVMFVAISASLMEEYGSAIWLYLYVLEIKPSTPAAKNCLHASICVMLYGEYAIPKYEEWPDNSY